MQLGHRRRTGAFRGRAEDRSLGAVLIEAAFVTPVFMVMVLGIMEIGLAMNDNLAVASTVRAGTRVASASGADAYSDYGIIQAIRRESSAMDADQIDLIVVYKAAAIGDPPTPQCRGGSSITGVCNVYRPADFKKVKSRWGCKVAEKLDHYWCPMDRKVSLSGAGPDYVGVWMRARHDWVTRMFGTTLTLEDSSVIRLEPRVKS